MKTLAITIHIETHNQIPEDLGFEDLHYLDQVADLPDEFAQWFGAFHEDQQPQKRRA